MQGRGIAPASVRLAMIVLVSGWSMGAMAQVDDEWPPPDIYFMYKRPPLELPPPQPPPPNYRPYYTWTGKSSNQPPVTTLSDQIVGRYSWNQPVQAQLPCNRPDRQIPDGGFEAYMVQRAIEKNREEASQRERNRTIWPNYCNTGGR